MDHNLETIFLSDKPARRLEVTRRENNDKEYTFTHKRISFGGEPEDNR